MSGGGAAGGVKCDNKPPSGGKSTIRVGDLMAGGGRTLGVELPHVPGPR